MRTPDETLAQLRLRLERTWSQVLAGQPWKGEVPLGTSGLTGRGLAETWPQVHAMSLVWADWLAAAGPGVVVERRGVSVHGASQQLPAKLVVADLDTAARLVGGEWLERLRRNRSRLTALLADFPTHDDLPAILRAVDSWSDVDVDLLRRAALWFAAPHDRGLTARQVPVTGLGTKWLARREAVVRRLAGVDDLGLVRGRPPRVHLTYLDPDHAVAGGRRHDVATIGDVDTVAYRPRIVLISENRDTAQLFPPVPGGIALEGEGRGAGAIAALGWVWPAEQVVYWGDMDPDGLEILDEFRAAAQPHGVEIRALFMDLAAYERWERFGVDLDHQGKALGPRTPRAVPHLEPAERALYERLCSPEWTRHRRIEQERIPLAQAAALVRALTESRG